MLMSPLQFIYVYYYKRKEEVSQSLDSVWQ